MLKVWNTFGHLYPDGKQSINFSMPHFNYVTIIDFAQMNNKQIIFYGDEIDLNFWETLGLRVGKTWVPENPLTLQSGWRYDYYATQHRFEVYNNVGSLVSVTNNIISVADMNIDFTIHKSHQFRIIYGTGGREVRVPTPADKVMSPFRWTLGLNANLHGINNECTPDRVRPYLPGDEDNPTHFYWWMISYVDSLNDWYKRLDHYYDAIPEIKHIFEFIYFVGILSIMYDKNYPNNKFYDGGFKYEWGRKQEHIYNVYCHKLEYLLPVMGVNMYPYLLLIQKEDELLNNRPLYEPWLIWGFYLLAAHRRLDDDDLNLDIFDLSPRYT